MEINMEGIMLPQIKIKFSLFGDCNEIEIVSQKFSIADMIIKRKKDCPIERYAEDSCTLEIGYESVIDLCILTDKLCSILGEKVEIINKIKSKFLLESIIIIVIKAETSALPITVLNREIITFAFDTNSEIHFDNYFD